MAKKQTPAKVKLKEQVLQYLSNPANTLITNKEKMAQALDIPKTTIHWHFTAEDYAEICSEALTARRGRYHDRSSAIDKAIYTKAKKGDVQAARLYYQVVEGFGEKTFHESRHVVVAAPVKKTDEEGNPAKKKT